MVKVEKVGFLVIPSFRIIRPPPVSRNGDVAAAFYTILKGESIAANAIVSLEVGADGIRCDGRSGDRRCRGTILSLPDAMICR